MKKIIISFLFFLSIGIINAQEAKLDWVEAIGGSSVDRGNFITYDASGNIYVTGCFSGAVDFDFGSASYILNSHGGTDIFIEKLDSSGRLIWAKNMGGYVWDMGYSIAIDNLGNLYITGYFDGTVDFDPGSATYNLTSVGYRDIFVQKLDSSGNFIWAKSMGGSDADYGYSISIDASASIYITGVFQDTADFDPGSSVFSMISAGKYDIFILKLDSAGNFKWAKRMGGKHHDYGSYVTVDDSANVYTTGMFVDTIDFDPGSSSFNLLSAGGDDIFIQKLDSAGNFIWAKRMGGIYSDRGNSIAIDELGNIFSTGYFGGTTDFDPGNAVYNLSANGLQDIYIQKLDSHGDFIWAKSMGKMSSNYGISIALDTSSNVYTTGLFSDTVDFDPGSANYTLISAGSIDIFIQKLDSAGNFVWAKRIGGSQGDWGLSIAVDDSANIYTTGAFWGTADLDPGKTSYIYTAVGHDDIYIQKFKPTKVVSIFSSSVENDNIKINLYPNPNNGSFILSIDNSSITTNEVYQVDVYDVMGKMLYSETLKASKRIRKNMTLESLNKGMYFISLKTNDNIFTTRFVVE
jgi:hypothetical protein